MAARSRDTAPAQELEHYLDGNEQRIPPEVFNELDDLAESIDKLVKEIESEHSDAISDLNSEIEQLKEQLEEAEQE